MVFGFKFGFWKFNLKENIKILEKKDEQESTE